MNHKTIFHTISQIDGDLVTGAQQAAVCVRQGRRRKALTIAVAVAMLLGLSAAAASVLLGGRGGHSLNIPSYYTVPDTQTLRRDIGIAPHLAETFSNGYQFDSGYIICGEDYGTDGSIMQQYNALNCSYQKGAERVDLYVDAAAAGIARNNAQTAGVYLGSALYYDSYTNKLVPPDYTMTAQDKADEASGKYVFSYGSAEVAYTQVQSLAWEYGGLNWELVAIDNSIPKEELVQMAKEIIDRQGEDVS